MQDLGYGMQVVGCRTRIQDVCVGGVVHDSGYGMQAVGRRVQDTMQDWNVGCRVQEVDGVQDAGHIV